MYVCMYVALVKTSCCYNIIINCTKCNHFEAVNYNYLVQVRNIL